MSKIILASNSPRRREILDNLGVKFDIIVSNVDEDSIAVANPYDLALRLARLKARDVANGISERAVVIAADTIVLKGRVFGKPRSPEEAFEMLKSLSGTHHEVITGIALIDTFDRREVSAYVGTKVYFKDISDDEINKYILTGEPMDKAGAYGIQGKASLFVEKIEGDYYNVVGLPVYKLGELLHKHFNINLL